MGNRPIDSESQLASNPEPVWARIERAHSALRDFLDRERSDPAELSGTRSLLEELPRMLADHFREEEASGGLYDSLKAVRPSAETQLDRFRREHRQILKVVEQLEQQLRSLDELEPVRRRNDCIARIREATAGLVRTIRRHERAESGLVAEVYYSDEGGSG